MQSKQAAAGIDTLRIDTSGKSAAHLQHPGNLPAART
jgi:hypothetical protein